MQHKWPIIASSVFALATGLLGHRLAAQPYELRVPHQEGLSSVMTRAEVTPGVHIPGVGLLPTVCADNVGCGDEALPDYYCGPDCIPSYCVYTGNYENRWQQQQLPCGCYDAYTEPCFP